MESPDKLRHELLAQLGRKLADKLSFGVLIRVRHGMGAEVLAEDLEEVIAQEGLNFRKWSEPMID
jgi:hypothetical protein